jgi:hypothetical protein
LFILNWIHDLVVSASVVTAMIAAAMAAAAAISGERAFIVRIVAGVAGMALPVSGFVALEVIEGLVSTAW